MKHLVANLVFRQWELPLTDCSTMVWNIKLNCYYDDYYYYYSYYYFIHFLPVMQ